MTRQGAARIPLKGLKVPITELPPTRIGYDDDRGAQPRIYVTTDDGLRFLKSYERIETGADRHEPPEGLLHLD